MRSEVEERAREKIEMTVISRFQRHRTHAAGVQALRPLIERAEVSAALKAKALAVEHDLPFAEFASFGPEAIVREILTALVASGSISEKGGKYTSALELPELSSREAGAFAAKLLSDWPRTEKVKVLSVFADDSEVDDEE